MSIYFKVTINDLISLKSLEIILNFRFKKKFHKRCNLKSKFNYCDINDNTINNYKLINEYHG